MKKLNFLFFSFLALSISSLVFTSCEDESIDPDKPYVGTWESVIFPVQNPETGDTIATQKMVFEFTNTSFEGTIYQGGPAATTEAEIIEATAMKGSITATDTKFNVEIKEVSVQDGPYTEKSSDPVTFATKFDASIGTMLEESFVVDYSIDGDKMVFVLPVKLPSGGTISQMLKLTKVN